jgi:hypothetical protein
MLRRTTAAPDKAVKFGDGRSAKHPLPKKKVSAVIRNTEQNARNEIKKDCGSSRVLLNVGLNSGIMTGGQIIEMTKRECRMTKAARNPNDEVIEPACCFEASCFVLNSSFVIRHSSFSSS